MVEAKNQQEGTRRDEEHVSWITYSFLSNSSRVIYEFWWMLSSRQVINTEDLGPSRTSSQAILAQRKPIQSTEERRLLNKL